MMRLGIRGRITNDLLDKYMNSIINILFVD